MGASGQAVESTVMNATKLAFPCEHAFRHIFQGQN